MNAKTTDRTWPLPRHPWVARMMWSELLFAHWPVDPKIVTALLPAGLELDTRDGQAWIGVVPFLMSQISPRCCPPIPKLNRFLELNVRTYVIHDGKPGVWFFSLDAENPVAVRIARATMNLPYMNATMAMEKEYSSTVSYRSDRTHRGEPPASFEATYQASGDFLHAQPGTLEHWLTARYCLYTVKRGNVLYRGEIDHPAWSLSKASWNVVQNTMGSSLGFDLTGEPHLLFAQPLPVRAWTPTRC